MAVDCTHGERVSRSFDKVAPPSLRTESWRKPRRRAAAAAAAAWLHGSHCFKRRIFKWKRIAGSPRFLPFFLRGPNWNGPTQKAPKSAKEAPPNGKNRLFVALELKASSPGEINRPETSLASPFNGGGRRLCRRFLRPRPFRAHSFSPRQSPHSLLFRPAPTILVYRFVSAKLNRRPYLPFFFHLFFWSTEVIFLQCPQNGQAAVKGQRRQDMN